MTVLPTSPSLALLDFQQSPSDKPMFDLTLHERSVSESSLEVQHSSPMTVPGSARQTLPYGNVASATDLPTGTVPDTPGPMQRAFDWDPANQRPWQNDSPTPLERYTPSTPILTPLPGTNLSVGDVDPEFVPLPPSMNPSVTHIGQVTSGYFDIPVHKQPHMDNADMLNGLACLRLAGNHGDASPQDKSSSRPQMGLESESPKRLDVGNTLHDPQDRAQALRHKRQAEAFDRAVRALNIPQHHQTLPFRPKQNVEDRQDQIRIDSAVSEDWETCSGKRSIDTAFEQTQECPSQPRTTGTPANSTTSACSQDHKRTSCDGSPADFAYIVWNSPKESTAQNHSWIGHGGLYDGSGYGKEDGDSATPGEPDEGTEDIHMQPSPRLIEAARPATLTTYGARSGEELSNGRAKLGNAYSERVQEWSRLAEDEQHDDGSLEFIYRAYT